jgi:hypothetical protein
MIGGIAPAVGGTGATAMRCRKQGPPTGGRCDEAVTVSWGRSADAGFGRWRGARCAGSLEGLYDDHGRRASSRCSPRTVMSSIMRSPSALTGPCEGPGSHRGFHSRAEGCRTFDARDRMPPWSRLTTYATHNRCRQRTGVTHAPSPRERVRSLAQAEAHGLLNRERQCAGPRAGVMAGTSPVVSSKTESNHRRGV